MFGTGHPLARLASSSPAGAALRPGDGLDYVRGGLCKPEQFKALPLSKPGANNDLNELFDRHLVMGATVYAFGEPYSAPEQGVHDVHQNQGNIARYRNDDGVWQDGGLLVDNAGRGWRSCCASSRSPGRPTTAPATSADTTAAMPKPPLPDELKRSCAEPHAAVIATLKPDGSPVTVATWYLWEDGRVLVNMDDTRRRLEHLRADPRVALTVLDGDWYRHV